ncbi:MAG TPA: hypothetical protein VKD72_28060 [Gemmataceae bacterium]|nr:hypothetical protein [Gemmataceae bacterium]
MAFCPKCNGEMTATQTACPHCGYDFPPDPAAHRKGLAWSPLAELALFVGTFAAGLGAVLALAAGIVALTRGEWLIALVVCPIAFLLQVAMLVVFVRVQHI